MNSSPLNPSSVFLLPWHGFVLTFLKGTTAKNSNNAQNVMEEIKLSSFTYRPADERKFPYSSLAARLPLACFSHRCLN